MKALRELAVIAKAARAKHLPVTGGKNGGGWCRLAQACGFKGSPTKEQAKQFLREWLHVNSSAARAEPQWKAEAKAKSGPVTVTRPQRRNTEPPPVVVSGVDVKSPQFLDTYAWRQLRMQALRKYGPKCMCCGATPDHGAVMNVDHIKPRKLFPHLALDLDNLQILCHECNHGKGNWDQTDWRPVEDAVNPEVAAMIRGIAKYG